MNLNLRNRILAAGMAVILVFSFYSLPPASAQIILPAPGQMVFLSPVANPPVLRGIKVFADKPLSFDFIIENANPTDSLPLWGGQGRGDLANKLIKYFLSGLTTPEGDLWVNLSPYEKNRIIPEAFGQTEMGRDLLAQDYILKQITASLIYPESETGKKFWKKVYAKAQQQFGTTQIPVNTFNKVWIVPEKAEVYEGPVKNGQATAYVTKAKLKVMLEEDYLALSKQSVGADLVSARYKGPSNSRADTRSAPTQIIREIIIPILEKEINEGAHFAQLRQIYYSLILATWYKKKIKDSIITKQYVDQKKVTSLRAEGEAISNIEHIYQQYLKSFKKGAYNYIKEEPDPITNKPIPRKYFSGGARFEIHLDHAMHMPSNPIDAQVIHINFNAGKKRLNANQAMQAKGAEPKTSFTPGELAKEFDENYQGDLVGEDKFKLVELIKQGRIEANGLGQLR